MIYSDPDLHINKTNNNMDEVDININSDETTYINDSEHYKSVNNIIDSENDLNTSNNNIDSENDLINSDIQNKKIYSNILPMSKARRTHLTQLNTLAQKITDDRIKDNVKNVLNLYENKNISQFTTAQKLIKSFISNNEKMIKKAELNLEKHKKAKPIDERMQAKYVRVEHKNMDKPQSSIKFKISQTYPNYYKALTTLKQKFITTMKNIFNTRPSYRICLGFNADYALRKDDLDARIGTDDPESQIENKYIKINNTKIIKEKNKMDLLKKRQKLKYII
jgi:hypothetical protein